MLKFNLVLALLFVNIGAYATDYYVNSNSSFPEPQVVTKVYMGDKMLEQKYVYSEQCYTPKKSFTLEEEFEKNTPASGQLKEKIFRLKGKKIYLYSFLVVLGFS